MNSMIDHAHAIYLTHLQAGLDVAHAGWVKCYAVGTELVPPPAAPQRALLPHSLAVAKAVKYLKIAYGVTLSAAKLANAIRRHAEVAGNGSFGVAVYGPGYAGGSGVKRITFNRYSLESLDQIGLALMKLES